MSEKALETMEKFKKVFPDLPENTKNYLLGAMDMAAQMSEGRAKEGEANGSTAEPAKDAAG